MAIDFSNIAGNIKDREGNRPTRPTQQQQNQYQQMAQSMADAGIGSLSGRTTDDSEGEKARKTQLDYFADRDPVNYTPYESKLVDFGSFSDVGSEGLLTETAGDPLKQSIVSNILRGKPPRETGIFGLDTSNLSLPTINPALGAIQGFQNTNQVLKKLSLGSELNSNDKLTLVNLRNNLDADTRTNLFVKYAEDNDVFLNDLIANFQTEYGKIEESVEDQQDNLQSYFDRMDKMGLGDTIKTMAGDLTGTRDTKDITTLEDLTKPADEGGLGTEGLQFLKVTDPKTYYRLRPNDPDLANVAFTGDKNFDAKIMEARAEAMNRQSRQDVNMGQGIVAASPALPGLPVTEPATVITPTTPTTNPVLTPVPVGGITPFDVRQFYASLPQYSQQGIMNPNLAQFYQNLGMFPGMTT